MQSSPSRIPGPAHQGALAAALLLAAIVGTSVWAERNLGAKLLPHGFCFTWMPGLLWLHVISDALIGLAYVSIPVTLWLFVRRRTDLPFNWIFLLFGLFIVSCGLTHFMAILTVWQPVYWLDGSVKAFTATVSMLTAAALVRLMPRALALPTVEQLRLAKETLEKEVATRRAVEAELRHVQRGLERRVDERTRALAEATAQAQKARAEAEAASRAEDEFILMLSHELRNPMTPITNAHSILERTQSLDDRGRSALAMATRQTAQLKRLVDDLLDTTRISQRRFELKRERVRVADVVAQVVQHYLPVAEQRGQRLVASLPPEAGEIDADPARLQQVLENLLSNAVKFTRDGDDIRVEADGDADWVEIRVSDDGIGIDAEQLPRVFDLFVQADTTLDRRTGGLGIGLAWVKAIAEAHGGSATAASAGRGQGTSFTVRLPRRHAASAGTGSH